MRNVLLTILACLFAYATNAQCVAGFTYTTSGLTATFTNTSTPTSVPSNQYIGKSINFGTGSGTVYFGTTASKTYSTAGTYLVIAYIEVYDSLTNTLVCSDLDSQWVTINYAPCDVNFSFVKNGNTVTYTANNLNSTPGMTYAWNFGDGNTGTGSPVTHTYAGPGNYFVTLVGSSTTANCSDSVGKTVTISAPPPNKISGMIIADSLYADTFKVWLIQYDSNTHNLYAVDSTIVSNSITQLAYYEFNNKPAGQYRTKAHQLDGPTSGTGYIPTYHTSSLYWNTATVFNHTGGNTTAKYILMQTGTVISGPGFIAGNVTMGANKGTAMGDPVAGMVILLRDNAGNVVKYAITDANGAYSFSDIPAGLYSIYPEEAGYATTTASVLLTQGQTSANAVNFEKSEGARTVKPKSTGIQGLAAGNLFSVSPNPSNGIISINWATGTKGSADVTVTDIAGRELYQSVVNPASKTQLDLSQLQAGMYFIKVLANGEQAIKQIAIQK